MRSLTLAGLLASIVALPACGGGGTFFVVDLDKAAGVGDVTSIELTMALAGKTAAPPALTEIGGGPIAFPTSATYKVGGGETGTLMISAVARNASGVQVATASGTATVSEGATVNVPLTLGGMVVGSDGGADLTGGATVPGAPTSVVASGGDASATVTWIAPASDGNSPITMYVITAMPATGGSKTVPASASSVAFSGLVNGSTYTFTVAAQNTVGLGPAATSNAVTPTATPMVPGAPSAVAATATAPLTLTVNWTAANNNGSPISNYLVTGAPGGSASTTGATSAVVSGLTAGQSYTFTVVAQNGIGMGPASTPSTGVMALDVPGVPTAVSAVLDRAKGCTVKWTAPASDGFTPITSYTVTSSPGALTFTTATGSASTQIVTGLTAGTSYTFTVVANNAMGASAASAPTAAIVAGDLPGAPTNVVASTAGVAKSATVSWNAPASNGFNAITGYIVTTVQTGTTTNAAGLSTTVSGLAINTSYTFTVQAVNGIGTGPASAASNSVIAGDVPSAPTNLQVCAVSGANIISFSAAPGATAYNLYFGPANTLTKANGTQITNIASGYSHPTANGTTRFYLVTGTNSYGESAASALASGAPSAAMHDVMWLSSFTTGSPSFEAIACYSKIPTGTTGVATRVVTGAATGLVQPAYNGIAVNDSKNVVFVANQNPGVGSTIEVWDNAATVVGNVAANRTLSPAGANLIGIDAIAIDRGRDMLYLFDYNSTLGTSEIRTFATASTATGSPAPKATISGALTKFGVRGFGMYDDETNDVLYVTDYDNKRILVFNTASALTGAQNRAPDRIIDLTSSAPSLFGVAVDTGTNVLYTVSRDAAGTIYSVASASTVNAAVTPTTTISGALTQLSAIVAVQVHADTVYALADGGNMIHDWSSAKSTTGNIAPTHNAKPTGTEPGAIWYVP